MLCGYYSIAEWCVSMKKYVDMNGIYAKKLNLIRKLKFVILLSHLMWYDIDNT